MMRFLRFHRGGAEVPAIVDEDGFHVRPIEGDMFGEYRATDERLPLASVRLAPPVRPSKIIAVALNYRSHLGDRPQTEKPELFLKPPSAVIAHEEAIVLPREAGPVHYEGEVVVVIGRRTKHVSPADAMGAVFGYTCGNDVSARLWQRGDTQWWRAKGSDTFSPLGPWIETDPPSHLLKLRTLVNGEERQAAATDLLIFSVAEIIAFAASVMTLEPGDAIYTGTPGTTGELRPGDVVDVEVGGVGVLRNPVIAEE